MLAKINNRENKKFQIHEMRKGAHSENNYSLPATAETRKLIAEEKTGFSGLS